MSDELAAYLGGLDLPATAEESYEDTAQSGRSPSGRLRNFGAMNNDKLFGVLAQVEAEGNDPDALAALRLEAGRR